MMESNLYSNIQALLKEILSKRASQKGKLRWTLEKKVVGSPSSSIVLIQLVLKELENCFVTKQTSKSNTNKVLKTESLKNVIPLLHTLYYAVFQSSPVIPTEVFQSMHQCLMTLMILPRPFSTVAMAALRSIKMEVTTPGWLYYSRVVSEQNLKKQQEKVFVLVDPSVCSEHLQEAIREHVNASHVSRDKTEVQINVILHVLRAGLGMKCHSSKVSQCLKVLGDQWTDKYFQQLSEVIEESIKQGAAGHDHYLLKLKNIYSDIVTDSTEITPEDQNPESASPMPFPDIQLIAWHNDDDLWDLLLNVALQCDPNSFTDEGSKERDIFEAKESRKTSHHCCDGDNFPNRNPRLAMSRRNALKYTKSPEKLTPREKMNAFNRSFALSKNRCHTVRVVVMGDDRVLGRLAKAYHTIREKESKHLILTKAVNLQFYYIPLAHVGTPPETPVRLVAHVISIFSLSSFLGQVDPWYNSNVNGLQTSITKLYEMHCKNIRPSKHNLFLLDTLCYYLRCGSHHVKLPLYSVKMTRSTSEGCSVVEEIFVSCLDAKIPIFNHLKKKSLEMQFAARGKMSSGHGASLSIRYARSSLSKRQDVTGKASMAYGVIVTSEPTAVSSGENYLSIRFDYMNPECSRVQEIRCKSLIITTVASRTLSVCLDQDSRRIYTNVERVDISQCVDPANQVLSNIGDSIHSEQVLSQYLFLPINTFSRLTP